MLKLLNCPRGHFWESTEPTNPCPECGAPADSLPLLDLAPGEALPPPVVPLDIPLVDEDGRPIVAGYEIRAEEGRTQARVRRYRARQVGINRDVLLEVVLAKEDASQTAWNTLRGESSALGKLAHPNIVAIHDLGERDRQLFYNALEFIDGPTLDEIVQSKPLPFPQIMRLVELLARALDAAHERGVLHRNLRPCSVLLQPVEVPKDSLAADAGAVCQLHDRFYIPKLTGFGLVRKAVEGEVIDAELFDEQPGYLSPEQAWGRAKDLGPNTDVYGLGGLLYYLLTGRPPFRGPTWTDTIDAIQTAELVSASVTRSVPADLEAVCRKCLARSPRRRYPSANEVADDLRRVQRGEWVKTKPPSAGRRMGRWIARHPGVTVMSLLMLVGLIAGLVLYADTADESERVTRMWKEDAFRSAGERAEVARLRTQLSRNQEVLLGLNYKRVIDRVQQSLARKENQLARGTLEFIDEQKRGFEWHYLMAQARGGGEVVLDDFTEELTAIAFGPQGGGVLATAHPDKPNEFDRRLGHLRVWNVPQKKVLQSVSQFEGTINALAYSPNGKRLAVAGTGRNDVGGQLYLFDTEKLGNVPFPSTYRSRATSVSFCERGERVVVGLDEGAFSVLSAPDGRMLLNGLNIGGFAFGQPRTTRLEALPGGDRLVVYQVGNSEAKVFGSQGGLIQSFSGEVIQAVAIGERKDGPIWVAVARSDASITIHNLTTRTDEATIGDLGRTPTRLAFSPDGRRLAAAFPDGVVTVWAHSGPVWVELLTLPGNGQAGLAFSSSGKVLAAGGGRAVKVWGALEE